MRAMFQTLRHELRCYVGDRRAATMIEYVLIGALIAVVLVASAAPIADSMKPHINDTTNAVEDIRTKD